MEDGTPHFDCRFPNRHCKGKSESIHWNFFLNQEVYESLLSNFPDVCFNCSETVWIHHNRILVELQDGSCEVMAHMVLADHVLEFDVGLQNINRGIRENRNSKAFVHQFSFENNLLGCPKS